jgi:hypothetical protein
MQAPDSLPSSWQRLLALSGVVFGVLFVVGGRPCQPTHHRQAYSHALGSLQEQAERAALAAAAAGLGY